MVEELLRQPVDAHGRVDPGVGEQLRERGADAAHAAVVLDADDEAVLPGRVDERRVEGLDPAGIHDGHAHALVDEARGHVEARLGHGPDGDEEHVLRPGAHQHVAGAEAVHGLDVRGRGALGVAHHRRGVVDVDGLAEELAQPRGVAGGCQTQTRHDLQDRHVPHAVVARPVVTGGAGPVEHEGDARAVQRAVHQHLVEGAVEEGGVHRDDRVQPAHREAGRRRGGVLLGDADVVRALGEGCREPVEPDRVHHRGGDRHEVGTTSAERDHLLGEGVGPDAALGSLDAGVDVELAGRVELVGLVPFGRVVAEALAGDDVHDHGAAELLGRGERLLDGRLVVALDRADVLQAQILEEALRRQGVLHALLHGVQRVVDRGADAAHAVEALLHRVEELLVARARAQRGEVVGQPADRRGVGAAVVVHDHHDAAVGARGDVVQRLPGHAAGQGAVADDRHDVTVLAADRVRLREPVGVGQGGRRVAVLHPVVLGLGPARVARQPALLAESVEAREPSGQHLVHVGLVAGVEDDRVARRVEHAVDGQRQLDDAEVGAEMAAGARDGAHERVPDLRGQRGQLRLVERTQILRGGDRLQQAHASSLGGARGGRCEVR